MDRFLEWTQPDQEYEFFHDSSILDDVGWRRNLPRCLNNCTVCAPLLHIGALCTDDLKFAAKDTALSEFLFRSQSGPVINGPRSLFAIERMKIRTKRAVTIRQSDGYQCFYAHLYTVTREKSFFVVSPYNRKGNNKKERKRKKLEKLDGSSAHNRKQYRHPVMRAEMRREWTTPPCNIKMSIQMSRQSVSGIANINLPDDASQIVFVREDKDTRTEEVSCEFANRLQSAAGYSGGGRAGGISSRWE